MENTEKKAIELAATKQYVVVNLKEDGYLDTAYGRYKASMIPADVAEKMHNDGSHYIQKVEGAPAPAPAPEKKGK